MTKKEIYEKLGELSIQEKQLQAKFQEVQQEQNKLYMELNKVGEAEKPKK